MGAYRPRRRLLRGDSIATTCLTLAGLGVALLAPAPAAGQMIYTQIPEPGETYKSACRDTPLHARPDAYSRVVGRAQFGTGFEVVAVTGEYLVPKSMRYSETHGMPDGDGRNQLGKKKLQPKDFFPAWTEVRHDGASAFITMRCLVSPGFFEQQTPEDAERRFEQAAIAEGGKGFRLKPASGGSGKGLSGQLAAFGEDRAAVEALMNANAQSPQTAHEAFRRAGGLGEFAAKIDDPALRERPARDVDRTSDKSAGEALGDLFGN